MPCYDMHAHRAARRKVEAGASEPNRVAQRRHAQRRLAAASRDGHGGVGGAKVAGGPVGEAEDARDREEERAEQLQVQEDLEPALRAQQEAPSIA